MDGETRMTLRLPHDLRDRLVRAADRNRRSMHAQTLVYIEQGLDQDKITIEKEDPDGR
jgi:predicted transcriptional regulator